MNKVKWQRVGMVIALVGAGVIAGANLSTTTQAVAEVRGTPEPPAFQSGGQQSVPILREISGTLRQIDMRLSRLETVAQKMQMAAARGAVEQRQFGAGDTTETAEETN